MGPAGLKIISHSLHRIGIVVNPFAGGLKGSRRARLNRAVEILRAADRTVTLFETPGPGQAGEMARVAIASGCDLVLAAGGDGTINEAVNGMVGSAVTFGALPAGTANVLAAEIGLAGRPDRAAAQLLQAVPTRISLGALDREGFARRHFVLMAGIGLDARIVYDLNLDLKARLGKLAYWHGGLRQLGRPVPRFNIQVAGADHLASFALVTRVRNYGGDFEIARKVKLTDPDFEIVVFEGDSLWDYLRFFGAVVANRLYAARGVKVYRAKEAVFNCPGDKRIYVQADGEAIGNLPAAVVTIRDALTVLIPSAYQAKSVMK